MEASQAGALATVALYYRISSGSRAVSRIGSKASSLRNCLDVFSDAQWTIIADRCDAPLTRTIAEVATARRILETDLGNSGSFRFAMQHALRHCDRSQVIYFVEDDYLHLPASRPALFEASNGLCRAGYVSLYDHPDKYSAMYGNGEHCRVTRSASTHWRTTISTTMTFAAGCAILQADFNVWWQATRNSSPHDHAAFCTLSTLGRRLSVAIPACASHCEEGQLAPGANWLELAACYETENSAP